MKRIVVLGASGSIGKSTLDLIRKFPQRFELAGFSVFNNIQFAEALKQEFPAAKIFIASKQSIKDELLNFILICKPSVVVNGIAGAQGLWASVACVEAGINLALANKESIVMAGELLQKRAKEKNVKIIPVDSEHSAIFSLINAFGKNTLSKIIITASGGPFRTMPFEELQNVTVEQALNHPTWKMGSKITIDSATLGNKALEVIEAVKLFSIKPKDIIVTVHKESIIHSMIQLKSGEIYAQASPPDMRFSILQSLEFPKLAPAYLQPLDFSKSFSFNFEPPRFEDFTLLKLGYYAAEQGASYPIAFNAANEVAVKKFIQGKIKFLEIAKIVSKVLEKNWTHPPKNFDKVFAFDAQARKMAENL